jgi:hypothetical protein
MYLGEIEWYGMNWIDVAQDRNQCRALVNSVLNIRVPQNAGKLLSSCTIGGTGTTLPSVKNFSSNLLLISLTSELLVTSVPRYMN